METPRYITQITGEWLKNVSFATNLKAGPGIKIAPDGDGIKIEVDQDQWKQWFWTAVYRGMVNNGISGPCTVNVTLSDLGNIILDPGL